MSAKTKMMCEAEKRLGKPLEDLIPEAYNRLGSLEAVGKELKIKSNTLYLWTIRLGLERKVMLRKPGDNGKGSQIELPLT